MPVRVQVILDESERERFRREAQREGLSLSAWMRRAAQERLAAGASSRLLRNVDDLDAFFDECDAREQGREPDWDQHRKVIERSRGSGAADT